MKSGTVVLIGRPNVGKSTLVNNLIGQKVAITSPKAQTTRFPIHALYQDERGEIIFVDTPGIFHKAEDQLARKINQQARRAFSQDIDAVIYMIDQSRRRDFEEAKILGLVRKIDKPKILVINKIDIKEPTYLPQYEFLKDEFPDTVQISSLYKKHLKFLLERIFAYLPEKKATDLSKHQTFNSEVVNHPYPALNLDSKTFIAEIIREKIFLRTRKELPYSTTTVVDEIVERSDNHLYIKARILTFTDVYKKMLIGRGGRRIKEIGSMTRRELETATGKKIYLDLMVETDRHWIKTIV